MKYMGWSYADFVATPAHVVEVLDEMILEEIQAAEAMRR
jgi:hypothetical protein